MKKIFLRARTPAVRNILTPVFLAGVVAGMWLAFFGAPSFSSPKPVSSLATAPTSTRPDAHSPLGGSAKEVAQFVVTHLDSAVEEGADAVRSFIGEGNDEYVDSLTEFLDAYPIESVTTVVQDALWDQHGLLKVFSYQESMRFRDGSIVPEQEPRCTLWDVDVEDVHVRSVRPCFSDEQR